MEVAIGIFILVLGTILGTVGAIRAGLVNRDEPKNVAIFMSGLIMTFMGTQMLVYR